MTARLFLPLLAGVLFLAGCRNPEQQVSATYYVFGTLVEIIIRTEDEPGAQAALAAAGRELRRIHENAHAWRPGELTRLNRALAAGRRFRASPFLLGLLQQARGFSRLSGGLFNPAIGRLIALWGFHADTRPTGPPPAPEQIDALVQLKPVMGDIRLDGLIVSSRNRAVQLDFGGFAKGAALDRIGQLLKQRGFRNAILNAGGDVNVLGHHGKRRWRVAIRHPLHWGVIASVELEPGEVLYTSGNYERYREHEGVRYAHIIDPRSGRPVSGIVSASVLARNGALADAAATALAVAGPENWAQVARSMGIKYALLVDKTGAVYLNPAMAARLHFEVTPPPRTLISLPLS